ncbi:MAG: peptidylprolyl isomerase [Lentisphaeria bacterium]|nr:peptidylprolyl isomerase [Lentisphaeria bacterium]
MQQKTFEQLKQELSKNPDAARVAAIQNYVREKIEPTLKVTDADIEKFYRENQTRFKKPALVDAAHILIGNLDGQKALTDDELKAKAEEILAQLKQGADFGKLAEKVSICPSGKQQGNLGSFPLEGNMDPTFAKAAFSLNKPGDLSPVVKTQFGYHIIKLNKKIPAAIVPLEEVKPAIRAELTQRGVALLIEEKIEQAKKDIKVTTAEIK